MKWADKKADEIIGNMILATLPKISVESGACRYNFRCQMNAVHEALNSGDEAIAMCFYLEGEDAHPIIHFLNKDSGDIYTDNTLGRWSERNTYYLVRTIDKADFFNVNDIFTAYRIELRKQLPWYVRRCTNLEF